MEIVMTNPQPQPGYTDPYTGPTEAPAPDLPPAAGQYYAETAPMGESAYPAQPGYPAQPADPAYSTEPALPAESAYSTEPAYAAEPAYTTEYPVTPTYPVQESNPVAETDPSTTDVAKSEAGNVKDTATEAAAGVAETAKSEAANVVSETKQQAKGLLDQVRDQLSEQGNTQKQYLSNTLHSLSKELGGMASKSEESGPLTDLAHRASRQGGEIAHWLENHEPKDVLEEVKAFARRRPVAFLFLAGAAGVLAGRLTRGAVAANTEIDSPDPAPAATPALEERTVGVLDAQPYDGYDATQAPAEGAYPSTVGGFSR
jgi:uncharacterized protein YjbJ (UPF0337 family)